VPVGSSAYDAAVLLLNQCGAGTGNILSFKQELQNSAAYAHGVVYKGNPWGLLQSLAKARGLAVTMQNGVAQWQEIGSPLGGGQTAYVISSDTGMIGAPSMDTKGTVSIETLLIPDLRPGSPISLQAKYLSGNYMIVSIETVGDTSGADWKHSIEARVPGTGLGT
jgi:hypothetical protein